MGNLIFKIPFVGAFCSTGINFCGSLISNQVILSSILGYVIYSKLDDIREVINNWRYGKITISNSSFAEFLSFQYWFADTLYAKKCSKLVIWEKPYLFGDDDKETQMIPGPGFHYLNTQFIKYVEVVMEPDGADGNKIAKYIIWFKNTADDLAKVSTFLNGLKETFNTTNSRIHYFEATENGWKHEAFAVVPRIDKILLEGAVYDFDKSLTNFYHNRQQYKERDFKYKRGYLLIGPPGCGKNTICNVEAFKHKKEVYRMSLNGINDMEFLRCCATLPSNGCFLIFNEFDKFVQKWFSIERNEEKYVTRAGFLEGIDGTIPLPDGTIVIICANDLQIIQKAFGADLAGNSLIRPGKIDEILEFKPLKLASAKKLFKLYFSDRSDAIVESWYEDKTEMPYSSLIEYFLRQL